MGQVSLIDPMDVELYNSTNRIVSSYRIREAGLAGAGRGAGFIPVDVAAVFDATIDRSLDSFAWLVTELRRHDAEATELYGREWGLPEGSTVFEPVYRQYLELEVVPRVTELPREAIWDPMPAEFYMVNRFGSLSDEEQDVLTQLGYVEAYDKAMGGERLLSPEPTKMARILETREALAALAPYPYKTAAVAGPVVVQIGSRGVVVLVSVLAAGLAIAAVAKWVYPAYVAKKSVDEGQATQRQFNAYLHEHNQNVTEVAGPLIEACRRHAEANGLPLTECARLAERLLPFQAIPNPGPTSEALARAAAGATTCAFGDCKVWSAVGVGVGLLAGAVAAKRLGLGGGS